MLVILGFYWRSWAALRAAVCSPGPLLEAMLAVLAALGRLLGSRLAILGPSWGLCCRSWVALWAALCGLGRSGGLCWRSWAALGACVGGLGPKDVENMATLTTCLFLERECDLRPGGQSWAALGAYVGGLLALLGPMLAALALMLAVLGGSWALCWRSGAALRALVGGLGGPGLKSCPNPAENRVWPCGGRSIGCKTAARMQL